MINRARLNNKTFCLYFLNEDFLGIATLCGMTNLCSEKVCKWQRNGSKVVVRLKLVKLE